MKSIVLSAVGLAALVFPISANAASDMYLKIEGIDGEAKIADWSFGACNAGQCSTVKSPRDAASGLATGKRQHSPVVPSTGSATTTEASAAETKTKPRGNWNLATNKARTASGGSADRKVHITLGDLDGDGAADLAYAGTLDEVTNLSLTFQKIEATWRKVCGGKHIASATLRTGSDSYEITGAAVSCTTGGVMGVDDWQHQMRLTGGSMKHTKTGHVTLLK